LRNHPHKTATLFSILKQVDPNPQSVHTNLFVRKMGAGMLSYTIGQLIKKLESMDVKACMRRNDVKNLVQSMHSIRTLALYAEAQQKQLGTNSCEVKIWLKELKDALDDIMHLLDDFSTHDLRHQNKKDKKVKIFSS